MTSEFGTFNPKVTVQLVVNVFLKWSKFVKTGVSEITVIALEICTTIDPKVLFGLI